MPLDVFDAATSHIRAGRLTVKQRHRHENDHRRSLKSSWVHYTHVVVTNSHGVTLDDVLQRETEQESVEYVVFTNELTVSAELKEDLDEHGGAVLTVGG